MRTILRLSLAVGVSIGVSHLAHAQAAAADDRWRPVREAVTEFLRTAHAGSVSIAVSVGDSVRFAYASGWADREAHRRADTTTLYSIASVTKPFTATALMRLVDRGAIRLDAPVNAYLGATKVAGRAAAADSATVARVLSHTAGLPEHLHFFVRSAPPAMSETIRRYGFIAFAPATTYQYSNLGYGMLGDIIARQTRMSYREALRRLVFAPLGMSAVVADGRDAPARAARLYDAAGTALPHYRFDHAAASAVYATATDLVRLGRLHLGQVDTGDHILSDSMRVRMQRRATPPDGDGYGMGWELGEAEGRRHVGHSGGMPGVRARLWLFPESGAVVALLVNGEEWPQAAWEAAVATAAPAQAAATAGAASAASPSAGQSRPDLTGTWDGRLSTIDGERSLRIVFDSSGQAHVTIDHGIAMQVRDLTFKDGFIYGLLDTVIHTRDTIERPGSCYFQLKHDATGRLTGAVYQESSGKPFAMYTLANYAELHR